MHGALLLAHCLNQARVSTLFFIESFKLTIEAVKEHHEPFLTAFLTAFLLFWPLCAHLQWKW